MKVYETDGSNIRLYYTTLNTGTHRFYIENQYLIIPINNVFLCVHTARRYSFEQISN